MWSGLLSPRSPAREAQGSLGWLVCRLVRGETSGVGWSPAVPGGTPLLRGWLAPETRHELLIPTVSETKQHNVPQVSR